MKKLLIWLMLLMLGVAAGEEADFPLEFRMELSQILFEEPGEVAVEIQVSNVSGEDMPGPMALYRPDGKMIEEVGTPTLAAGESRTWEGTWCVTEDQLKQGRVIFALMYICQAEDGTLNRKTQSYYVPVKWAENPAQKAEIVLKGNASTGYVWDWELPHAGVAEVRGEYVPAAENSGTDEMLVGASGAYRYTIKGVGPGEAEIRFWYHRPWEEEVLYTLIYRVQVDEDLNVTILSSSFGW